MSFQDYMNNRQSAFKQMTETLKQDFNKETSGKDDRIWKPQMGKDGTGYAVVRLLPGSDPNKTPWVKVYDHAFTGPSGKWYIENSLTTLGKQDPVSEYNTKLWNNGTEAGKEQARKQKRRTYYYANALVLQDPANPASEGKVVIYRFGQKIFDKIMEALQPKFADEKPLNPFDMFEGANLKIKIKTVAGYWNYDSSEFDRVSPISEDESKLEGVFNAQHNVHEFIDPDNFKSYEDLQNRLNGVLGVGEEMSTTPAATAETTTTSTSDEDLAKVFSSSESTTSSSDDDEDLESYFKSLASD